MLRLNFLFFFCIIYCVSAQDYNDALKCFLAEDYVCSKSQFAEIINNAANSNSKYIEYSHYYLFLSSLNLYNEDTELLFDNFMERFPFSEKKHDAVFFISEYLFEKKKYQKVVDLLSDMNLYKMHDSKRYASFFYLGYSCYKINKYDLAQNSFYELINTSDHAYKEDAIFYDAYISLLRGEKALALSGFKLLTKSIKYFKKVPYLISKILFDLEQYDEMSDYLEPILDSNRCENYKELILLNSKALYHLEKYDPAIVYFEEYKQLKDTLTRSQLYQMGIAYYHKGLFGFAINHLNKIVFEQDDSLSQYAFYYLGDSYRKTQNFIEAMNAFRSASLIDLDPGIQHDSYYQFVILCYEQQSPLYDPVQHLSEFAEKYPQSEYVHEIYSSLANIYLNTYNYDEAISVLEKSALISDGVKKQYQKICFHKAVQLYNDELYEDAVIYFNKSISVGDQDSVFYQAHYWKAESYYNLNFYNMALTTYAELYQKNNELYQKSLYSQAYCHLKLQDYSSAIQKFTSSVDYYAKTKFTYDIYMRLGDSYFALMDYQLAIYFYDKALIDKGLEDDYALYKKSTAYVLLNDYNSAILSFKELIKNFPTSNYIDDAIFDLGNTYILANKLDLALNTFLDLIDNFSSSLFYAESKLKVGLVYYMQSKDTMAVDMLKNVINTFPNTNISQQALHVIKNIYDEMGQVNQFLDLLQSVDHNYTKADLDSSTYYSGELQYMQENYQNAINAFNSYLSYYPEGLFYLETNYYLYKAHEKIGDLESAIKALNNIVNTQQNKYTIEGVLGLARMSYELEKYISAEMYFSQLLDLASEIDLKKEAILGLLESQFHLYKYSDVVLNISKLVHESLFSGRDELRIHYLKAYSLYKMNKTAQSLLEFKWLIKNTEGELRAEAFYYAAVILYNDKKYDKCQDMIFQLINELPGYQIWTQKSLLILAKTYLMQEDFFQAQHVLIELEKKSNDPDVLKDVRKMLQNHFSQFKQDSLINTHE